jgi:leader peptidase (prepilin peptidase)/N-methyltransferase
MGVGAVVLAGSAGLLGGALVPMTAYRLSVPFEEPDRTACIHCGHTLSGWVRLPSSCAVCGRRLGPPAGLTAAIGAVVAGTVVWAIGPSPVAPLFVALTVLGVLLGAIDIACARLPHVLVVPAIAVSVLGFAAVASIWGPWSAFGRVVGGSAALAAAFGLLHLLPGRAVGRGDVTLAALLGGYLGWLGWPSVVLGGALPWLVNAPVLIALLAAGRIQRRAAIPFGPAMLVGAWLTVLIAGWLGVANLAPEQ